MDFEEREREINREELMGEIWEKKKTRYITSLRRKRGCKLNCEGCKKRITKKQKENERKKKKEMDINE